MGAPLPPLPQPPASAGDVVRRRDPQRVTLTLHDVLLVGFDTDTIDVSTHGGVARIPGERTVVCELPTGETFRIDWTHPVVPR